MELFLKSDVCTAREVPCQVALAKGQNRKRWEVVSSSSSQRGHKLDIGIPLLLRVWKVGKLSCKSLHTKLQIFEGTCTFQIRCHKVGIVEPCSLVLKWTRVFELPQAQAEFN